MTSTVTASGNKEGDTGNSVPILVPNNAQTGIKNLDRIPPYETHKIGVLYIGKGQAGKEAEILSNEHGSVRYMDFLHKLGQLISLNEVDTRGTYIGGLEVSGEDGKFAYMWKDDVLQVIFHVATLMPTKPGDPACTNKKRHIGNNFVTIVYNDSGEEYQMNTIRVSYHDDYNRYIQQPLIYCYVFVGSVQLRLCDSRTFGPCYPSSYFKMSRGSPRIDGWANGSKIGFRPQRLIAQSPNCVPHECRIAF